MAAKRKPNLKLHPATARCWNDLETLFGLKGACAGCWCMWWRFESSVFEKQKGTKNKRALKRLVEAGPAPGILAYADGQPIGWCAVAPRDEYPRFARSRVLKKVDDQPVWSVTCFFVAKSYRRQGVSAALLKAAVQYAKGKGASIVEGYPVDSKKPYADTFAYHGLASVFGKTGFREVARRSPTRPIMRYVVKHRQAANPTKKKPNLQSH